MRERKICKQPWVKGFVVVKTLVRTLWFLKRLVYHMKDILLWNKGSPYLNKNVSILYKKYFPQRSRIEASHVGRPRHFGSLFLHITLNSVWTLHTMHSACKIYQERQSIHPDQMPSHQTGWSWSSAALTFLLGSVEINTVHIWSIYEGTFKWALDSCLHGNSYMGSSSSVSIACSSPPSRLQLSISAF